MEDGRSGTVLVWAEYFAVDFCNKITEQFELFSVQKADFSIFLAKYIYPCLVGTDIVGRKAERLEELPQAHVVLGVQAHLEDAGGDAVAGGHPRLRGEHGPLDWQRLRVILRQRHAHLNTVQLIFGQRRK